MLKKLTMLVAAAAFVLSLGTPAHAVLSALGPINPVDGLPTYVQDTNGLILTECLIGDGLTGPCVFLAPDPLNPFSVAIGFNLEMFYFDARWVNFVSNNNIVLIGVEGGFLPTTAPGNQQLFQRIRWTQDAPVAGTYTLNHPYGTVSVNVAVPGIRAIKFTSDTIGLPPTFTTALSGPIGPFLQAVAPAPPVGFIGSPLINQTFTGSPLGRNSITVIQPGGTVYATTNTIQLSGHIGTAVTPTPLAVSRATYGKDLAPSTAGQLDVFAQAPSTAAVSIAANVATGVPSAPMAGDPNGNFFGHAVLTNAGSFPGTLIAPTTVTITADNSVALPSQTPTSLAVVPVDNITVTSATYDVLTNTLAVSATSSDKSTTSPVMTLTVPALPAGVSNVMTTDPVTKVATISVVLPIAPPFVTVASATGGNSGSNNVIVTRGAGGVVSPAPVAVNDAALIKLPAPPAPQSGSVVIPLLFNDTPGTTGAALDPTTVVTTQGLHGVVSAPNPLDGSVTYTSNLPAPGGTAFTGVDQFTYTVKDKAIPPNTSNTATVVVTIQPGLLAPVAGNDIVTTAFNTAVAINVIANDTTPNVGATINGATVTVVTAPLHGTVSAPTAAGVVTYTPTAGFTGADSFTYNVKDSLGALSNTANVAITVTAGPPVAVNDTAFSNGVAISIPVLANDTAPGSTLNPASVLITTAPLHGTATVNTATGAINYTPANGFGGTDTLNYTVKNALGVVSNVATVTIGVEFIKLGSAQYTTLLKSWAISGNSTVHTGETMTFYVGSTIGGTVIGTAPVGLNGNFTFSVTGSAVAPGTATTISCQSSTGGTVLGFPLQIR